METTYHEISEALQRLWENKNLPLDARRYITGAIYQAGVRQGDEIFPREIFQQLLETHKGERLHPDQQILMFEKVHEFVFINHRLRPQYLTIILRQLTDYLNKNHQAKAREFEMKLARHASMN